MPTDSILTDSFYPVCVAADITGYNRRTVYKLIERGLVRSKIVRGRRLVHLGSLLSCRKDRSYFHALKPLHYWLICLNPVKRCALTYPELAVLATHALGLPVSDSQVHHAFIRLKYPHRL